MIEAILESAEFPHARKAGKPAGDQGGPEDHGIRADASEPGGPEVNPHRLVLVPEGGLVVDEPDHQHREQRDQNAQVKPERGIRMGTCGCDDFRRSGPAGPGLLERAEKQRSHDVNHDVVQQRLETTSSTFSLVLRMAGINARAAGKEAAHDDHRQDQGGRNTFQVDPEDRCRERSCEELAFGADVPELGPESKRRRQAP